jgi:hypothetical protein
MSHVHPSDAQASSRATGEARAGTRRFESKVGLLFEKFAMMILRRLHSADFLPNEVESPFAIAPQNSRTRAMDRANRFLVVGRPTFVVVALTGKSCLPKEANGFDTAPS